MQHVKRMLLESMCEDVIDSIMIYCVWLQLRLLLLFLLFVWDVYPHWTLLVALVWRQSEFDLIDVHDLSVKVAVH